jgi:hypothetical protein
MMGVRALYDSLLYIGSEIRTASCAKSCNSGLLCAQVSFHDRKAVRKTKVEKRNNDIVNRLNRTKREENPDLASRRNAYDQVLASICSLFSNVCTAITAHNRHGLSAASSSA